MAGSNASSNSPGATWNPPVPRSDVGEEVAPYCDYTICQGPEFEVDELSAMYMPDVKKFLDLDLVSMSQPFSDDLVRKATKLLNKILEISKPKLLYEFEKMSDTAQEGWKNAKIMLTAVRDLLADPNPRAKISDHITVLGEHALALLPSMLGSLRELKNHVIQQAKESAFVESVMFSIEQFLGFINDVLPSLGWSGDMADVAKEAWQAEIEPNLIISPVVLVGKLIFKTVFGVTSPWGSLAVDAFFMVVGMR